MNPWPNLDNEPAVQQFIDELCDRFEIKRVPVMVRNAQLIGNCLGLMGDNKNGPIIMFNGPRLIIHAYQRANPPVPRANWQKTERLHTVLHEFIHHLCEQKYSTCTKRHPPLFKRIEVSLNKEYGIWFDYEGEYAKDLNTLSPSDNITGR